MTDNQHAINNAKAWFKSIREMVAATDAAKDAAMPYSRDRVAYEEAETAIHESPLGVLVRDGWYPPHERAELGLGGNPAVEYEILLTTGGPALRIIGELNEHADPTSAVLQWQDWGTPWTTVVGADYPDRSFHRLEPTLLSYASHFYFGGLPRIAP